jgi:SAM-dependent methyltransferase
MGVIPSPNIWEHPGTYELENQAFDPDGLVESAIRDVADWAGRDVLDIGCGSGFHLPRFAATARSVTGVEPHAPLVSLARRRTARWGSVVSVLQGSAEALPVPDSSVDVAHARWAYFFGAGAEPGLAELSRVVRRGGAAFVIDNDGSRSTFGRWFRAGYPTVDPAAVERFWTGHGWSRTRILTEWHFEDRAAFEAVVAIEFDPRTASNIVAEHDGCTVDYAVDLWWRRF